MFTPRSKDSGRVLEYCNGRSACPLKASVNTGGSYSVNVTRSQPQYCKSPDLLESTLHHLDECQTNPISILSPTCRCPDNLSNYKLNYTSHPSNQVFFSNYESVTTAANLPTDCNTDISLATQNNDAFTAHCSSSS